VNQIGRYCPDRRDARTFAQLHPGAGRRFGGFDGLCPEWYGMAGGAAVLPGTIPGPGPSLSAAELTGRAA
jgi:hypothetical protein